MEKLIQTLIAGGGVGFAGAGGLSFIPYISISETGAIISAVIGALLYATYIAWPQVKNIWNQ